MMKRTLILVAVLALALGISANAFLLQASVRLAGGGGGGVIQIGDPQTSITPWVAPLGDYVAFASVQNGTDALLTKDLVKPMPAEGWDTKVWGTAGLADTTATLKFWVQQVGNGTTTGSVVTGQDWEIVGPGGQLWHGVLGAAGSESSPIISLPIPIVKAATGLEGATYIFRPVGEVIPEPGSMLALGSGLIGLIGFGIRRRK